MVDRDTGQPWDEHLTEGGKFRGASFDIDDPSSAVQALDQYIASLPTDQRPTSSSFDLIEWESPEQRESFWATVHRLHEERKQEHLDFFVSGARSADHIADQYTELSEEELERLSGEGQLLSREVDGEILYPAWQFDRTGVTPELPSILERSAHYTSDALSMDLVMRGVPHDEIDGRTILEAMGDPTDPNGQQTAWWLLDTLGGYR